MAHQFIDEAQFGGGYGSTGCTIETDGDIKTDGTITAASVNGITTTNIVQGPASATDNAVARFDLTTGKLIQDSVVTIADTTGNMAGVGTLGCGAITSSGAFSATTGTFSSTLSAAVNCSFGNAASGSARHVDILSNAGQRAYLLLTAGSDSRWEIDRAATSGDFSIRRLTGSSSYQDSPITIASADGVTTLSKTVLFPGTRAVTATGAASAPENAHGTYTPTLTNGTNVGSSTAYLCQTHRVGNSIIISGVMDVTSSASGATSIGVSLPVASAFTATTDAAGVAICANQTVSANPYVFANATDDRLTVNFTAAGAASHAIWFFVSYTVK